MIPYSSEWVPALAAGHQIMTRIEIYDGIVSGTNQLGTLLVRMENDNANLVINGDVQCDYDTQIRRSARISIVDPSGQYIPNNQNDSVWYGRVMRVYRGIKYPATPTVPTHTELILCGTYKMNRVQISTNPRNRVMTIAGRDFSYKVARARFTVPQTIAIGTNVVSAITNLLTNAGITRFNFTNSTAVVGVTRNYDRGANPWDAATELAGAIGMELYFDVSGTATLRIKPDPATSAINWRYTDTGVTGDLGILDLMREASDEDLYSHVVASGESAEGSVRADAYDLDPNSPTFVNGSFGDVPFFVTVAGTTATADAQAVADRVLKDVTRNGEVITLQIVPNPAMEPGDIIYVYEQLSKTNNAYVLDGFTMPMDRGNSMTIKTVKQKVGT